MIEDKNAAAEQLADRYQEWADRFGVSSCLGGTFKTVAVWVETCAPPGATEQQKLLACMDIGVWFFYLDDHPPEGYRILARKMNALLRGWYHGTAPSIAPGCVDVLRRMTACVRGVEASGSLPVRDPGLARYVVDRCRVVRELGRRKRSESTRSHPTYSAHLMQRENTIFIDQWMSLWEILGCCVLSDSMRYSIFVRDAVMLVKRWHVFANEVRSIERDLRTNTPNLVVLFEREMAVSRDEARRYVAQQAEHCRARFGQECVPKFRSSHDPELREWGEILTACMFGGEQNYQVNTKRYESVVEAE